MIAGPIGGAERTGLVEKFEGDEVTMEFGTGVGSRDGAMSLEGFAKSGGWTEALLEEGTLAGSLEITLRGWASSGMSWTVGAFR